MVLPLHSVDIFLNGPVLFVHELNVLSCMFQNLSTRRLQNDYVSEYKLLFQPH